MEPSTCFNLSDAIANWRNELRQQETLTEDAVRELEQHLVESMDDLRRRGLSEAEAFLVASRRVGSPSRIS